MPSGESSDEQLVRRQGEEDKAFQVEMHLLTYPRTRQVIALMHRQKCAVVRRMA